MKASFHPGMLAAAVLVSCYQAPSVTGSFRCINDTECGVPGYGCESGLCCRYDGQPLCPSVPAGKRCSDGGFPTTYYRDLDGDGFGDPTQALATCVPPVGYSSLGGDCNDHDPTVHPGAPELCDGVDHDCDGITGNNAIDAGLPCAVPGKLGACDAGITVCEEADGGWGLGCKEVVFPTREVCDGIDNNCDGRVDERPACGGPPDLLTDPSTSSGVEHLLSALNYLVPPTSPGGCLKDFVPRYQWGCGNYCQLFPATTPCMGSTLSYVASSCDGSGACPCPPLACYNPPPLNAGELDTCQNDHWVSNKWTGERNEAHLLFFETTGPLWDLRNSTLALGFDYQAQGGGWQTPPAQPVVLFCGEAGQFLGFIPLGNDALTAGSGTAQVSLALDAGTGWSAYGGGSTGMDLSAVRRIEILVDPQNAAPPPLVTLTFQRAGLN